MSGERQERQIVTIETHHAGCTLQIQTYPYKGEMWTRERWRFDTTWKSWSAWRKEKTGRKK